MIQNIQKGFKEIFQNFHKQRINCFKKIRDNTDEELLEKCKSGTKLEDLNELLKEIKEFEELGLGKLRTTKNKNDIYYTDFTCNLCSFFLNLINKIKKIVLIKSSSDLKFKLSFINF